MLVSMITGIVTLLLLAQASPYAGSGACKTCHPALYARWSKTRMANVVTDPRTHPETILPDLSKPNPVFPFTKDGVAFVYGSKWKQRYFKKVGDDYYPMPAQWDVIHKTWAPYIVKEGTDWWGSFLSWRQFQAAHRSAVRWLPF